MNKKELIKFENDIAELFNNAKIKAPIHLHSNNENFLIKFFKKIKKNDWIFCSWRSHYHCLLKGVPRSKVKKEILDGKSISLCFPEYGVYSSAIVGGNIPIAVGMAISMKKKKPTIKKKPTTRKKQGYNAKLDESLGMRRGKESGKKQSMKSRRDESKGMAKKVGKKRAYGAVKTMDKKK